MDDLRAVLDAAGVERALLVARRGRRAARVPVRGHATPNERSGSC